jgi:hypothetical protein
MRNVVTIACPAEEFFGSEAIVPETSTATHGQQLPCVAFLFFLPEFTP